MWDVMFWRHTFFNKCKSQLRMANIRIEAIRRRRKAMQKFLKNDIADLIKTDLVDNAYGRAEGLCLELTLSWCYDYTEECCTCVLNNLKSVQRENDCPKECRVAIASLMYGAARFADLPELRNLRDQFTEKYGNSLDSYVDIEFAENLRPPTPSMAKKLRLMKDIAAEYTIDWDSTSFEQKLRTNSTAAPEPHQQQTVDQAPPASAPASGRPSSISSSQSEVDALGTPREHLTSEADSEEFRDFIFHQSFSTASDKATTTTATSSNVGDSDNEQFIDSDDDDDDNDSVLHRNRLYIPPYAKKSPSKQKEGEQQPTTDNNNNKTSDGSSSLPLPPARRPLYFPESRRLSTLSRANDSSRSSSTTDTIKRHLRTLSLGSSDWILSAAGSRTDSSGNGNANDNTSEKKNIVHPKLPDYEDLTHRMLALRH